MSLTTDITGGLFGPSDDELKWQSKMTLEKEKLDLLREHLENQRAAKAYEEAKQARRDWVSRYYQRKEGGGPTVDRTKVNLFELGEPTSYGGQQPLTTEEAEKARQRGMVLGAEGQPIEVIRGGQASYVGPRGGKEEYATPGQARQAFRRDLGIGEYIPPGATLEQLKPKKQTQTDNLLHPIKYFEGLLINEFGVEDPQTKERTLPDYVKEPMLRAMPRIKTPEDALKVFDEIRPQLQERRRLDVLGSRENRERVIQNFLTAQKMGLVPEEQTKLDPKAAFNAPITAENARLFEYWLNWQPPKRESKQIPGANVVQGEGNIAGTFRQDKPELHYGPLSLLNPLGSYGPNPLRMGLGALGRGLKAFTRDISTPQPETFENPPQLLPRLEALKQVAPRIDEEEYGMLP